nr:vacuolar protein sorting-associated protein 9A-like isoform X1 [Ipomoea batatas]
MEASSSASSPIAGMVRNEEEPLKFDGFLSRMRNPAAFDLHRSIKGFTVSFPYYMENSESDGERLQAFLLTMESKIRSHPLWAGATDNEIDCAVEGLEKFVTTKLYSQAFASSPDDAKIDEEITEKICLLQQFMKPKHLDIPSVLQDEALCMLAANELKKIDDFKAPREKLLCILKCCKLINNLLLNVSATHDRLHGADNFLPLLIYATIKANPPRLHSNLKYIQLYRRHAKLVSEAAYYFMSLASTKSFIFELDEKSISMDETEFLENMKTAKLSTRQSRMELCCPWDDSTSFQLLARESGKQIGEAVALECQTDLWKSDSSGESRYPFMEAEAGELAIEDVEKLLQAYKDVVKQNVALRRVVRDLSALKKEHL